VTKNQEEEGGGKICVTELRSTNFYQLRAKLYISQFIFCGLACFTHNNEFIVLFVVVAVAIFIIFSCEMFTFFPLISTIPNTLNNVFYIVNVNEPAAWVDIEN
jgi:hypothetical protein